MSERPSLKTASLRLPAARRLLKAGFPLLIGVACIVLLNTKLDGLDLRAVADVVRTTSATQWIAAAAATALSFWAIGTYDVVVHRHLRTGVSPDVARVTGASSIAIAQVLGLGVVTGSLARWRMLQGVGGGMAAAITGAVSASFLGAWALVTVLLALILPGASLPFGVSGMVLMGAVAVFALAFAAPKLRVGKLSLRLPSLRSLGSLTVLALIDIIAAAAALHVLMPAHLDIGFEVLLPIFAIALGCGLFSSTPGGAGPFELALLTFLPQIDQAPLLGAVLAWRLVYYAVPAVLAIIPLAFPYRIPTKTPADAGLANLSHATRAECGVMRQNGGFCLPTGRDTSVVAETGQTLTLMFDPLNGSARGITSDLSRAARDRMLIPVIYKCSAPLALAARDAGWRVVRVADDAVIDLTEFSMDGSKYRQLRRKLRNVEKADIAVFEEKLSDALLDEMARIDVEWVSKHDAARGFSMGHFCPEYVARQRIFVARKHGVVLGFVTFHQTSADMALDLMRHGDDLPDGVMHAMIVAAIEAAKDEGRTRLSLAALPAKSSCDSKLALRVREAIATRSGGQGLTRFKQSFGVRRQPLYAAAPSHLGLTVGLADIARAIHAPRG